MSAGGRNECPKCNRPFDVRTDIAPGETFIVCRICRETWLSNYPKHHEKLTEGWARRLLDAKYDRMLAARDHAMLYGELGDDPRWQ
jgi:hypothetical protein